MFLRKGFCSLSVCHVHVKLFLTEFSNRCSCQHSKTTQWSKGQNFFFFLLLWWDKTVTFGPSLAKIKTSPRDKLIHFLNSLMFVCLLFPTGNLTNAYCACSYDANKIKQNNNNKNTTTHHHHHPKKKKERKKIKRKKRFKKKNFMYPVLIVCVHSSLSINSNLVFGKKNH